MGSCHNKQKYAVRLSRKERGDLERFIRSRAKKATPSRKTRARILLCLDENGDNPLKPVRVAEIYHYNKVSVYNIRIRFADDGLKSVLYGKGSQTPATPRNPAAYYQRYRVRLTRRQRKFLEEFIESKSSRATPSRKTRATVLLYLDENSDNPLTPGQTARICHYTKANVYLIRKRFATNPNRLKSLIYGK